MAARLHGETPPQRQVYRGLIHGSAHSGLIRLVCGAFCPARTYGQSIATLPYRFPPAPPFPRAVASALQGGVSGISGTYGTD
ncbi:MAG: hypothetical protein EA339_11215 [Rhodobacteraceae bacterium]|nr:MAG: hypothetical protein EA339_11215 [Paracoccaceae bacterium]